MGFFEVFAAALAAFYGIVRSYGLAIILLTIAVRILLLPLTIKQMHSMREMQKIAPEVKKLQTKHKGDRAKLNQATMALYKEHGVNPLGGCLPLLLQFPALIALFRVLHNPLQYMGFVDKATGAAFDWVRTDVGGLLQSVQNSSFAEGLLNHAASLNQFIGLRLDCSAGLTLRGSEGGASPVVTPCPSGIVAALPYLVLVLLMGATTYYQQKQMQGMRGPMDEQAKQMQMMMKFMPLMLVVFSFQFPAGLVLYWLTTNLWTIGQQAVMMRMAGAPATASQTNGKATGKPSTKPSPGKPPKGGPTKASAEGDSKAPGASPSKPHPSSKKKKKR